MIDIKKLRKQVHSIWTMSSNKDRRDKMNRFVKYFKGHYWKDSKRSEGIFATEKESEVFANLIFSTAMTVAPMLTDNKPIWTIQARQPFMQTYAKAYKLAGDALWPILDMDMKLLQVVLDALIMGLGLFKVYFDPEEGEYNGEISVDVVDPRTFVIPPGYTDTWKAPWCGTITARPMSWIQCNYPDRKDIKPDRVSEEDIHTESEQEANNLGQSFVTVYEIFTKDDEVVTEMEEYEEEGKKKKRKKSRPKYPNGRYLVFTANSDKPLVDKEYPYNHGKAPFIPLYDYLIPHSFWGMGEADQIETLTLEFNMTLRKFAKHVRNWADPNFYATSESGLDPDKWKEDAPGGGNMFVINPGSTPPVPQDVGPFNKAAMDYMAGIPGLIEEVSGVTDITKGMVAKKQRQSAHEISALVETAYTRTRQRVRNLEWTIKRVFILMVEIMQEYYSEARTYPKKTEEGENEWVPVSNSPNFATETAKPQPSPTGEMPAEDSGEWDEYKKMIEYIGDEESVYADFIVDIETNSTLPMDKQSLANLALRLFEMHAIDVQTVLEAVKWPNAAEAAKRVQQAQQAQQAPPQGVQ